ncbi:type I restriction-modification system endonuclease [Hoeflea sp. Naph1]|uniref:type I restriction-modification system endonuclease n=1 Tax=Hoeflea sp. Naph1 TaxID=3388653 RepID=UPI00398F9258
MLGKKGVMVVGFSNFAFLESSEPQLRRLGVLAERYFSEDPNTCNIKLRQFSELVAQLTASRFGLTVESTDSFADILRRLKYECNLPREVGDLFHALRVNGNRAAHQNSDDFASALSGLKIGRQLAIWFTRTFHDSTQKFGPFVPPQNPKDVTETLLAELDRLKEELVISLTDAERHREAAQRSEIERQSASERAAAARSDREIWELLAEEAEKDRHELVKQLQSVQQLATAKDAPSTAIVTGLARDAANQINLDEADTRVLIDQQLRDVGWEVDTKVLRFASGSRPMKGRNRAISEWPTASGPSDYALFCGMVLVGTVEAKRQNRNVMEVLRQAERYSVGIKLQDGELAEGGPWGEFKAPFAFSTNGRSYLKQVETLSGIWRRDLRDNDNPAEVLAGWPSPRGLLERLSVDKNAAYRDLAAQPFDFGFPLRPYQRHAIEAVEKGLIENRRTMLVAMATGTGKTKLAIAMLYRLISAKRFRRVCFVVDRSALGEQTEREFTTTKVVNGKAFADIFGLKGLDDAIPDDETRIHICTIQGLVRRVLYAADEADAPSVDQYDLIVVDECHRGYLLDREMSDTDITFRSQDDYVSKYRRVLEYFDAVKIGLTATPALHTTEIFGLPVFTYSYREAVIDGFLVDHEPPVRIGTMLSEGGIHFLREDPVDFIHAASGTIQSATLPDDIDFEVEQFNKGVITVSFNRAIAQELTNFIDPSLPDKTLVFAVTDAHADIVVNELRTAFRNAYGALPDATVQKITGKVCRSDHRDFPLCRSAIQHVDGQATVHL